MSATYEFATPRDADTGLIHVRTIIRDADGLNTGDVLRDEQGHVRLFRDQAEAVAAGVEWKRQQESEAGQP